MSTIAPEQTGFELERFQWSAPDRLEVEGRWFGVRGRRFVRPVLTVQVRGRRTRLLASLEHKPWTADEGESWLAAFPWQGSHDDVGEAELEVGALTVDLPAPGGPTRSPRRRKHETEARKPKPAAGVAEAPEAPAEHDEALRRPASETRQQLERDLAGARAELGRLRTRHDKALRAAEDRAAAAEAAAIAAAEREQAAAAEAARLRTELEAATGGAVELERMREAEAAARAGADREREAASAAKVEAERHRVAASEASAELESTRADAQRASSALEAARAEAAEAAETAAELTRLRATADRFEQLGAEAERLREEHREATAEVQRLRQANRRATAEAERLRAAAARPSAPAPRRAAAPEPPVAEPASEAEEGPGPSSKGARPANPRDPQATVAFDALAEGQREPAPPPHSGPPPTVRRIPPREPGTSRPDPLAVVRPEAARTPLHDRSSPQVWAIRIAALVVVAILLAALALIVAGVL